MGKITYFEDVPEYLKGGVDMLGPIFVEKAYERARKAELDAIYLVGTEIGTGNSVAVGYFSWNGRKAPELSGLDGKNAKSRIFVPLVDRETDKKYLAIPLGFLTSPDSRQAQDLALFARITVEIVLAQEIDIREYAENVKY